MFVKCSAGKGLLDEGSRRMQHYSTTSLPDRLLDEPFLPCAPVQFLFLKIGLYFFGLDFVRCHVQLKKQFFL